MALDAVIEEIREKARREAGDLDASAQAEVQRILTKAQQKAEGIKISTNEEVERQTDYIIRQEKAAANLAVKREILNSQKEILDQVFLDTVAAIANLPAEFHAKAAEGLLSRIAGEIPEGIVFCNSRDAVAVQKALSGVDALKGFSFGGSVEIAGGIVAETRDGSMQLDYSYHTFLTAIWESGLKDASQIMFG